MKTFLIIWLIFMGTLIPLLIFSSKYKNPYKLIMIFGKKGSGKSTLLTRLAVTEAKHGKIVYSNMPIYYPGIRIFDPKDIGKRSFPEGSVVFIDEAGSLYDNRNFKEFKPETRDWFKLQRKHKVKVYLFSQTFDVDVKLRNLTDLMFMCTCHFNVLSVARRVNRKLVVVEPTGDSEGRITDGYEIQSLIWQLFGFRSIYLTWIPAYKKYFDTRFMLDSQKVEDIAYEEIVCNQDPEDDLINEDCVSSSECPDQMLEVLFDDIEVSEDEIISENE